jgi:hypothetical protein
MAHLSPVSDVRVIVIRLSVHTLQDVQGVRALAESLKTNTTLQMLDLQVISLVHSVMLRVCSGILSPQFPADLRLCFWLDTFLGMSRLLFWPHPGACLSSDIALCDQTCIDIDAMP